MTFGGGKRRTTIGIPGTGISYTEVSGGQRRRPRHEQPGVSNSEWGDSYGWGTVVVIVIVIFAIMALFGD